MTPSRHAFSLFEILAVLVILTVAFALGVPALVAAFDGADPRRDAERFALTLAHARQHALDRAARVRVAFSPDADLAPAEPRRPDGLPARAYGSYVFRIPAAAEAGSAWTQPTLALEGGGSAAARRAEYLPASAPGLPRSLVGRWLAADAGRWTSISPHTRLESELFEVFRSGPEDEFPRLNGFTPEATWVEGDAGEPGRSPYPADYARTPYPAAWRVEFGAIPGDERIWSPGKGSLVPASELYPDSRERFVANDAPPTHALPFVEFGPDGAALCAWTSSLRFAFSDVRRPQRRYEVWLDPPSGLTRLVDATVNQSPAP